MISSPLQGSGPPNGDIGAMKARGRSGAPSPRNQSKIVDAPTETGSASVQARIEHAVKEMTRYKEEAEKHKMDAEKHKRAAHELAKAAKEAKKEAAKARKTLDEERELAQRNQDEADKVIHDLQAQLRHMHESPRRVMQPQADISSLLLQLKDSSSNAKSLMEELKRRDEEITAIRWKLTEEREQNMLKLKDLEDSLAAERENSRKKEATTREGRIKNDEGTVAVLTQTINNRERDIADLRRQLENAKILSGTAEVQNELQQTQRLLAVRTSEVDTLQQELTHLKSDCERLLEDRQQRRSVEDNLTKQLDDAHKMLRDQPVGMISDQHGYVTELLKLQEDLLQELGAMKTDMATLAVKNKSLEDEKALRQQASPHLEPNLVMKCKTLEAENSALKSDVEAWRNQAKAYEAKLAGQENRASMYASQGGSLPTPDDPTSMRWNDSFHDPPQELTSAPPGDIHLFQRSPPLTQRGSGPPAASAHVLGDHDAIEHPNAIVDMLENEVSTLKLALATAQAGQTSHDAAGVKKLEEGHERLRTKCAELQEQVEDISHELQRVLEENQTLKFREQKFEREAKKMKEEIERLQTVCEQQSKWVLEATRSNRDRLLLVELHAHILNIMEHSVEIENLKHLVETQKNDNSNEGTSISTRDLPIIKADPSEQQNNLLSTTSLDGKNVVTNSRLFASNPHSRSSSAEPQPTHERSTMQRSAAPLPPPDLSDSAPVLHQGNLRVSDHTPLRDSQIEEMLGNFPDNRGMDMYASNREIYNSAASGSSLLLPPRSASAEPSSYVPEIADDILNYQPPSTAEARRSKLEAAKPKDKTTQPLAGPQSGGGLKEPLSVGRPSNDFIMPSVKPSDYMKMRSSTTLNPSLSSFTGRTSPAQTQQDAAYFSAVAQNKYASAPAKTAATSLTPSEYMKSRGMEPKVTQQRDVTQQLVNSRPSPQSSVRQTSGQGLQPSSSGHHPAPAGMSAERLAKFAEYQEVLQLLTQLSAL